MPGVNVVRTGARRRIIAVLATGGVLLAGATVTSLAAWLDEEWVVAGVDGDPGVSASSFEIEQRVATDAGSQFNRETAGAAGVVEFDDLAQSLSPGTSALGWVSLRAAADSVNGTLSIVSDYTDGASALGDVLTYGARIVADEASCTTAGYAVGTVLVADGTTLETGSGATTFQLVAGTGGAAGAAKTVCFQVAFPSGTTFDSLQGATAQLGWHFEAVSD